MTGLTDRLHLGDDRGVSIVLGAMLLTGMALLAFVSYQTDVVPKLQGDAQNRHLQEVSTDLIEVAVQLGSQAAGESPDAASHPLSVGYEAPGLVTDAEVSGALTLEPEANKLTLSSNKVHIQQLNDTDRITQPEEWLDVNGSGEIEDIARVDSLRLKLDEIAREMVGDHVVVNATDAEGDPAGTFRLCLARHAPDWDLHYLVKDGDGTVVYNNAYSYFQNQVYRPFWVNVLDPNFRFGETLAVAEKPLTLNLSVQDDVGGAGGCPGDGGAETGAGELAASYAVTYRELTDAGAIVQGGGGLVREDYRRSVDAGRLVYETTGAAGSHRISVEHGAVAFEQDQGAIFRLPPSFDAFLSDNTVVLQLDVPVLEGGTGSATGTSTAVVRTVPQEPYRLEGQASNLTINLTTEHPDLWIERWDDELSAAGLGGSVYDTANGSDWARLDVWGLVDDDPASETLDVFVRVEQTPVQVRLEG